MVIEKQAGILATGMMIAIMTLSAIAPAGAASPDAPREDVFGRSTAPAPRQSQPIRGHVAAVSTPAPLVREPHPQVSKQSPPQEWFDAFDTFYAAYKPTQSDKFIINKPFNQEAENVMQFCKTVSKVARNYRTLARKIKSMPIPDSMPDVKEYKDLTVNWYLDSALVYEDMVRPRPPARTKEELNSMIQDISDRSESLKQNRDLLQQMDSEIRLHHHVNPPKADDAIFKYAGHH